MLGRYLPATSAAGKYSGKYGTLPVEASVKRVSESFQWHDDLELICVIDGVIEVQVNNKFYILKEDEIILINDEDVHRIDVGVEPSAYISIHLDLKYIDEAFPDTAHIWYSCNPTVNTAEKEPALCRLRSRFAQILLELKDKSALYENRILLQITSILNILINNFNLIGRDPESYKDTEQFERIWSIIDYIYINSAKRISLKDVAQHVHLSDSYLSHCIKDNTGMSFEDLLNFFRAEISIKMLLTSNLSITKISYDCGFSDTKYYNKYFQKFFNCSPSDYRNKNKLDVDIIYSIPASEAITYDDFLMAKLRRYISEEQTDKGLTEDVISLGVDLMESSAGSHPIGHYWNEFLDVGDKSILLDENTQWLMYDVQDDIKFRHILVQNLLYEEILATRKDFKTYNWEEAFKVLDFIKELKTLPLLVLNMRNPPTGPGGIREEGSLLAASEDYRKAYPFLGIFVQKCSLRYGPEAVSQWKYVTQTRYNSQRELSVHPLFDTAFMAPYFINSILNQPPENRYESFTGLYDAPDNQLFNGGLGLLTSNGLKKPLYHAYHFLSCLGDTVLSQGTGYLLTRRGDNLQILLYNLPEHVRSHPIHEIIVNRNNRYEDFAQDDTIHFNISINHLFEGEYVIKQYKLDRDNGSIFDKFNPHEAVKYLTERDVTLLNNSCYPRLKVSLASHCRNWNLKISISPNCVEFITINASKSL
jgi:AraC-like DNA-binding protein/beta-xylosidase